MVVAKIIDLGPEPIMMDAGYNMHADRSAHGLANMVASAGPVLGDAVAFEKVLDTFVSAVRQLPGSTAAHYVKAARAYLATLDPSYRDTFRTALLPDPAWLHQLLFRRALGEHPDELDPAIPCVAVMCGGFQPLLKSFRLVHDHSKVIERGKWTLLNIGNLPDVADPTKLQASIGVHEIDFADSTDHPQLQIADWVAGFSKDVAMVQWYDKDATYPPEATALQKAGLRADRWQSTRKLIDKLGT